MPDKPKNRSTPEYLNDPSSYPHKPEKIEIIQTHASYVAIVPPWVYKIKKKVDLGFMDFTTLAKRKVNARREVHLNRRLAPDIYKGVIPVIARDNEEPIFFEEVHEKMPSGAKVVDYAVKMKLLEAPYFFKTLLKEGRISLKDLDRIIEKLVKFYKNQNPPEAIIEFGSPESIRENTQGNFTTLYRYIDHSLSQPAYDAIKYYTDQFFECNEAMFYKRMESKKILDCHGDLHLEHIHLHPDRLSIFDCIEFNDRFRYVDIANDIAFLTMDLDFHNKFKWSRYVVTEMQKQLEDPDLKYMTDFYKVYRACVRGKVESIKSKEDEVSKSDREESRIKARKHLELALRYCIAGSGPMVLLVMGNIATGKSTLAQKLSEILNWPHFNSDVVRKELTGIPVGEPASDERKAQLYSDEQKKKVYDYLKEKAFEAHEKQEGIVLDATFGKKSIRQAFWQEFIALKVPFTFIEASAPEDTIKERLLARGKEHNQPSDARSEDFEKLYNAYETPVDVDQKHFIRVNTTLSLDENLTRILNDLVDQRV